MAHCVQAEIGFETTVDIAARFGRVLACSNVLHGGAYLVK